MTTPSAKLLRLLAFGAPLWILAGLFPLLIVLPIAWIGGLLVAAWMESRQGPGPESFRVGRDLPTRISYDEESMVTLQFVNRWKDEVHVFLRDEVPDLLCPSQQMFEFSLSPGQTARLQYCVKPTQRGGYPFHRVLARVEFARRLVVQSFCFDCTSLAKVYPRFRSTSNYELLARIAERSEARKPRRMRARGSDYDSLRPYVPGDDPRNIEWKSTARRGQLICKEPRVEKGQHIALLVDTGRLTAAHIDGHPRLEYFLEGCVRLSYVVQKRGDTLSLACFSNTIDTFIPSLKKHQIVPSVMEALCTVQPRSVESDYWGATARVLSKLRRRSLVVLFTNVLDPSASKGLIRNMKAAASRHLVLCVVLSDPTLQRVAHQTVTNTTEGWMAAAACDMRRRRRLALETMRSSGILVLECEPKQLSHQLIRRYLDIRRENLQ